VSTAARVTAIRSGAIYCCLPMLLTAAYVAATWDAPHRGAMLAVVLTVIGSAGLALLVASRHITSRWWMIPQHLGAVVNLAGYVALALLDGGVAGPLGTFIPASTVLLATVLLPRSFATVVVLNTIGYAVIVVFGEPAPPGYWLVHALAFGAAAVLCLRHSMVLASLRQRLADSSRTDPLTGCLNRRGYDQQMRALDRPGTLVLLDLDHFKQVNDGYGHAVGDQVLIRFGECMRLAAPRRGDCVARYGGEEFTLVLVGAAAAGARAVLERLQNEWLITDPLTSFSAGVAVHRSGEQAAETVARADAALYRAKQTGRARWVDEEATTGEAGETGPRLNPRLRG
jgi:diguanylate cyclase (GGDEF)-like protein